MGSGVKTGAKSISDNCEPNPVFRPFAESERTAAMCHAYYDSEWGDYGSAFIEAIKAYQHPRHYQIVSGRARHVICACSDGLVTSVIDC